MATGCLRSGEASVRHLLWWFLRLALEGLGGWTGQARDQSTATVCLCDGKERLRYRAGDRCDGPVAQCPFLTVLPDLVGDRFHPTARPGPREGRRCFHLQRAEDRPKGPPGLPAVHLHRERSSPGETIDEQSPAPADKPGAAEAEGGAGQESDAPVNRVRRMRSEHLKDPSGGV
ncbi:hypothetical protein Rleg_6055 (plasmid) [Rhizobium leguminosarum bv. trifolii WSM1325]|uniref:Uncharacterized protein n=1 Tax=Rhizobium leguminosarum bv. trifolii (strain WSM1325) TaxID=395491 RepID=C6BA71_RHILS|nr:hypothetical protein Rleg_6055 [Rhizobium leguminosarum bv. trifolii WSM1325]